MNKRAQTAGTASSTAASGKKKVVVIGVVVVVLLLVIVFVFVGRQLVGKAIASQYVTAVTGLNAGEAGAVQQLTLPTGNTLTLIIGANIGVKESVAYEFTLNYPSAKLEASIEPRINWAAVGGDPAANLGPTTDDFQRVTPVASSVKFEYATLDTPNAFTGAVELARVLFTVKSGETLTQDDLNQISFTDISVYDLETSSDIFTQSSQLKQPTGGAAACVADDTLCKYSSLCVSGGYCGSGTGTFCLGDVNLDAGASPTAVGAPYAADTKDIVILQLAEVARSTIAPYGTCGGDGEDPCDFNGKKVCDNAEVKQTGKCGASSCKLLGGSS